VADLTFLVEVIVSIAAVAGPIVVILALLFAGDFTIADLFIAPTWDDSREASEAKSEWPWD
jgi:hypothetical protein